MNEKELYRKKRQAQLDEWKADLAKLKAKASRASAEVQLKLNDHIKTLEGRIEDGRSKLAELAHAGEDRWDSLTKGVESAWKTLKSAMSEAISKFKD